ncbi:MAG TPA: hypothetical protein V6D23_06145 [Candidatus Obscuribacterales bacterium]
MMIEEIDGVKYSAVEGITYFLKPWEYGTLNINAEYGQMLVGPDKLIMVATHRKKIAGGVDTAEGLSGLAGGLMLLAAEVLIKGKKTQEYRLEIPRASIQKMQIPLLGFGNLNVIRKEGMDELNVMKGDFKAFLNLLIAHRYPVFGRLGKPLSS